ncbi:MAG: hypothetical protein J1E84_04345 [Muribaculaceae bacterium]|nr:hypothetical protein [Muribaculaceae bacterium]
MNFDSHYTPAEQPVATAHARHVFSIGLPASASPSERRFPLTPEAVGILVERGFSVDIESGAAEPIHYTDNQYAAAGARIVDRATALRNDIVIHLAAMKQTDIRQMRRGALLFTLFDIENQSFDAIRSLLQHGIIAIAIDLIQDSQGNYPFADILAEIDGRASIATASSLLADSIHGKGILLGGVAGVIPCEVTILGSGIAACAAARSAAGLGALVRMFDDDVYALRRASRELGSWLVGSSMHPRVLDSALRTADVVIVTPMQRHVSISTESVNLMKRGVITFDLTESRNTFPSIPYVDLAHASPVDNSMTAPRRVCYTNAGSAVPRTAAMALSDTFTTTLYNLISCEGITNAIKLLPGLQKAVYTFLGKAVNSQIAAKVNTRRVDISIYLTLS